jgi:hypothetical protein
MRRPSANAATASVIAALFFLPYFTPAAGAQAWLPRKDTGTASFTFQALHIKHHTDVSGLRFDRGTIDSNVFSVDVDYGLTRRWAVNATVPFSRNKYIGNFAHVDPEHNLDDGHHHSGVQDFRFGARYSLLRYTPIVVTPFVEAVVPSHDYVTFAHAALGRNLRELMIGANLGWEGESFLPNAYFQTRVSYGFVERVLGRSHNRTNIDSEFTYRVLPRLSFSALTSYAKHHGGLDWDSRLGEPRDQWTAEERFHHDELTRADAFDVGLGTSFRVSQSTSVYGSLLHTAWSRNAHPLNTGLILGISRQFRTRPAPVLPP